MEYTKEQILAEMQKLYNEIDDCIDNILDARKMHDRDKEMLTLGKMEGLMVGIQQDLTVFTDYLTNNGELK